MPNKLSIQDLNRATEALSGMPCSQDFYMILSSNQVRANWDRIKSDPDNPRPELDCEQWIAEAKSETMIALGMKVRIQDSLV